MDTNTPPDPLIPAYVAKWCWFFYVLLGAVLTYCARDAGPLAPYQWWLGLGAAALGAVLGVSTPHLLSTSQLPAPLRPNRR